MSPLYFVSKKALFPLGDFYITTPAYAVLSHEDVESALSRHASGDWGEIAEEDRGVNESALAEGARLLSVYRSAKGVKFWIITEADRSVTTVLLPDNY